MTTVRRSSRDRFVVVLMALLLCLGGLAGRLAWIQVVEAPAYAKRATDQRLRDMTITPKRGAIYDRNGEPLAISVDAKTIYAVPHTVTEATATAGRLAAVLGGQRAFYLARLHRDASFVYIARKVDTDRAKKLEDLKIPGIGFLDDSKRAYPCGDLACQVLGFVGVDDKGLAGIESQYDTLLGGKAGSVLAERDPYGRPIPGGVMRTTDAVNGKDVVLTIDKDIQYEAQHDLASTVASFGASYGSVLVMDPRNGEILAMASTPSYDPNDRSKADPRAYANRSVSEPYEPGSAMKPFTAGAVIDRGLFTTNSKFVLPPTLTVGGRVIHEAHSRGTVTYSLAQIIAESSNVGAVKLGQALGKASIFKYLTRFGFDTKTGVDLPGESRGNVPDPSVWSASSIGNIPFGQGMSATPLQIARGLSAFADAGRIVTPHLLLSVPGEGAPRQWPKSKAISAKAAALMTTVLRGVVTSGTGTLAAVPGYEVAGKTGTAQIAKHGIYAAGAYTASFVGFLPANDPQLLIVVSIDEPTASIYGGTVAAPMFRRVAQFSVDHLKIPPSASAQGSKAAPATGAHD
jgi:cell division protein FtsI (penicillin-binding protein 3)